MEIWATVMNRCEAFEEKRLFGASYGGKASVRDFELEMRTCTGVLVGRKVLNYHLYPAQRTESVL
jgi:hypothetical protein